MEWPEPEDPFQSKNGEEVVPTVDPADMNAVWHLYDDVRHARPATEGLGAVAMGAAVMKAACSPGADVRNVWYRMAMLELLFHIVERTPDEPEAQALKKLKHGED
jgi:hypothetical protein